MLRILQRPPAALLPNSVSTNHSFNPTHISSDLAKTAERETANWAQRFSLEPLLHLAKMRAAKKSFRSPSSQFSNLITVHLPVRAMTSSLASW
jgi:hypothetical protein